MSGVRIARGRAPAWLGAARLGRTWLVVAGFWSLGFWILGLGGSGGSAAAADDPSFTRDIKGLLSNRCIRCHGPDAEDRHGGGEEGLRLDISAGATADLGGHAAIVPGNPAASELLRRVTSTDPDVVMPPPEAGERLSDREIDLLRRWIAAGATYEPAAPARGASRRRCGLAPQPHRSLHPRPPRIGRARAAARG
jgi:mono/diheme cytochrome c family protein